MCQLPEYFDKNTVKEIDIRLYDIEQGDRVKILWCIESGSRAWGFPSPDSDYDCRFIYVRPLDDYLSLWPYRDVIETPLDHIFDVNGWDLQKALKLMLNGNAVVIEWLQSPIIYQGNDVFRREFLTLIEHAFNSKKIGHHYLQLMPQVISSFLNNTFDKAEKYLGTLPSGPQRAMKDEANTFFQRWVRYGNGSEYLTK